MKRLLLVLLVLFPYTAFAQQPVPEYTIKLTLPEWQAIGDALIERPYKTASPILGKINAQINEQQKPPPPEK